MRILLIGPTAVGKTELSVALAERLDAEIISADSRQCYRYLDIGTATPPESILRRIRHYNINLLDPKEKDSAADFYERAMQWEDEIAARRKNILYVGGSTLHLQVILQPLDDIPNSNEENIRKLERRINREGIEPLYRKLREVDPQYADNMDGMNPQRIVRALDVWMQTGKPFSSFHTNEEKIQPGRGTTVIGLKRDREHLYERINRRTEQMVEQGFLEEVRSLLDRGYTTEDPGLDTVGYREAVAYLENNLSEKQMIRDIQTRTRRYAKRQLTWFRRWKFIHWIDLDEHSREETLKLILEYLAAKSNKD